MNALETGIVRYLTLEQDLPVHLLVARQQLI